MSNFKLNIDAIKRQIQPAVDKAGLAHIQKLAQKLFTAEERRKLKIELVAGKVKTTGPQDLLDRLKAEIDKK